MHDFVIPYEENKASFSTSVKLGFNDLMTGWVLKPSEYKVMTVLPQKCLMVREFSRLVTDIKDNGTKPEKKWPTINRKTQLTLDAVKESVSIVGSCLILAFLLSLLLYYTIWFYYRLE